MEIAAASADIVIFGGGIAGLWLLNRLRQAGLSVLLFESGALGGGQTLRSQGIIHGGTKYALQGILTKDAEAMTNMPLVWRDCLLGKGEIDLSSVPILSQQHYLWSPNKFTAKLTGFLASTALHSKVATLAKENYPAVFQYPEFKGEIFSLDEMVIDVPALIRELVKANQDAIFKIEPLNDEELKFNEQGDLISATVYMSGKSVEIKAQQFIFTAGAGNEVIVNRFSQHQVSTQRRPLHMVLVKTPFNYPLYAHCLGLGNQPRITITTHKMHDDSSVWYLGGALAEQGITRSSEQQIIAARAELSDLFPWLDFTRAEFASFMIDRAEAQQKGKVKPESSVIKIIRNMMIAWPTKLALAPKLSADVIHRLEELALTPQLFDTRELRSWPMPPLAKPIWEEVFC